MTKSDALGEFNIPKYNLEGSILFTNDCFFIGKAFFEIESKIIKNDGISYTPSTESFSPEQNES